MKKTRGPFKAGTFRVLTNMSVYPKNNDFMVYTTNAETAMIKHSFNVLSC